MARDHRQVYESLLRMTVANGCTEDEQQSARTKAEAIAKREGFPWPPLGQHGPRPHRRFDSASREAEDLGRWTDSFFNLDAATLAAAIDALARKLAEQEMSRRRAARDAAGPKGSPTREARKRAEYASAYGAGGPERPWVDPLEGRTWRTVKACAEDYLLLGWSVPDVLRAVRSHFPGRDTKEASIRWYASKMRKARTPSA